MGGIPEPKCRVCSYPFSPKERYNIEVRLCDDCIKSCPHCGEDLTEDRERHEMICPDCKAKGLKYLDD